jgi:hypothetical protein
MHLVFQQCLDGSHGTAIIIIIIIIIIIKLPN